MDFATIFDPVLMRCDWVIAGGDLAGDDGLASAVLISFFSDRLAADDVVLPAADGDRRGHWGDLPLDDTLAQPDFIGSLAWLLVREKQTVQTLARAIRYFRESLQWMLDDGVAAAVDVIGEWHGIGVLALAVTITQRGPTGIVDRRFAILWDMTLNRVPAISALPPLGA